MVGQGIKVTRTQLLFWLTAGPDTQVSIGDVTGYVSSIMREDGSGKRFLVRIATGAEHRTVYVETN